MHDDDLDAYTNGLAHSVMGQMDTIKYIRGAAEGKKMSGVHAQMNSQMMAALSAGQNSGIQGLPIDAQEHLSAAALDLSVELRQIVPFNTKQVLLELNGKAIPVPSLRNTILAEGFLMGKKGAKAAAVANRMTEDATFGCDVAVDVRQAKNWLRATYEMETGEEL